MRSLASFLLIVSTAAQWASSPAFAQGGRDMGGGNVLVCPSQNPRVILLDYWEAQALNGMQLNLGAPNLSVDQRVELLISRLDAQDKVLANRLRKLAVEFNAFTAKAADSHIIPVNDSNLPAKPDGCDVVQIARQKVREFPHENIYFINLNLWNELPPSQQAGLVLHELLYRIAIEGGATNSAKVRYFNGLLATGESFSRMDGKEYWATAEAAFPHHASATVLGANFEHLSYYDGGDIGKGRISTEDPGSASAFGQRYKLNGGEAYFHDGKFEILPGFSADGNPGLPLVRAVSIKDMAGVLQKNVDLTKPFRLNKDGEISAGSLKDPFWIKPYFVNAFDLVSGYWTVKLPPEAGPVKLPYDSGNTDRPKELWLNAKVYCYRNGPQQPNGTPSLKTGGMLSTKDFESTIHISSHKHSDDMDSALDALGLIFPGQEQADSSAKDIQNKGPDSDWVDGYFPYPYYCGK